MLGLGTSDELSHENDENHRGDKCKIEEYFKPIDGPHGIAMKRIKQHRFEDGSWCVCLFRGKYADGWRERMKTESEEGEIIQRMHGVSPTWRIRPCVVTKTPDAVIVQTKHSGCVAHLRLLSEDAEMFEREVKASLHKAQYIHLLRKFDECVENA